MPPLGSEADELTAASKFRESANRVRVIAETMLKEHFGERCKGYGTWCSTCQRWKALDDLLDNPYVEELDWPEIGEPQ